MRIIGGYLKGRLIEPPTGLKARPTTDFARESLFNILNNRYDFSEVSFLDLFSGTGAISFEMASRGAREIDLVEMDRRHCDFIRKTLTNFKITSARVHHQSVTKWVDICRRSYNIVFADPPYDITWLSDLPDMIMNSVIADDQSLFILEHPGKYNFEQHPCFSGHRHYGSVNFSFFSKTPLSPNI